MIGGLSLLGALLPVTLIFALSGCADMLESKEVAERIYWLEPASEESALAAGINVRVDVVPGLNSDRIWILEQDQRLNYYAGARWTGNLVDVLQSIMDRSLNPAGTATADPVSLDVLIERFFAVATGSDQPPGIELRARIRPAQTASAGCVFAMSTRSESLRLKDIVQAHQWLLNQLTSKLAEVAELVRSGEPDIC
jgi:ABC-type uncharacterized transport system auxiliary subunit